MFQDSVSETSSSVAGSTKLEDTAVSSTRTEEELPGTAETFYEWQTGKKISYTRVRYGSDTRYPPVVLLTGFGVGSFHYHRLCSELHGRLEGTVYLVDFFGQGNSWPTVDPCPSETPLDEPGFIHGFGQADVAKGFEGFRFSADMWTEQIEHFLEEVVGGPAILCGNSLGGFISANLAAQRPDLVRGLVLLNATPFWGTTSIRFWDGTYPVPRLLRLLGTRWWNAVRDPDNITRILDFVYARPLAAGGYDRSLVGKILEPTLQPAAASVFCSIIASPPPALKFDDMLAAVRRRGIPCMLAYGRDDPWVIPLWGLRAARELGSSALYYELTPCGHCPQDESPATVARLLGGFAARVGAGDEGALPTESFDSEDLSGGVQVTFYDRPRPRTPVELLDCLTYDLKRRLRSIASPGSL